MSSDISESPLVTVLMSTYNGGQFLQEQLSSLYEQTYAPIKIVVRDDGSTDATLALLAGERSRNAITQLDSRGNLGATGSFFTLLRHAAQTKTDYVAFCDQDDVWLANKIERAVSRLAFATDRPALYCSRLEIVNKHLQTLKLSIKPRKIGFGNALVENVAVGCTMVLNRKALDLLCRQPLPNVYVHDWWCYLVISCFGDVIFDDAAPIKYRQHGRNAIGAATNPISVWKRKLTRFINARRWISEQAAMFLKLFSDHLSSPQRALVADVCNARYSYACRIRLALSADIWRNKWLDNIILRLVILANRI